jgi:hypothetical protein
VRNNENKIRAFFRRRGSLRAVAPLQLVCLRLARRLGRGESSRALPASLTPRHMRVLRAARGSCGGKRRVGSLSRRGSCGAHKSRKTGILYNYHFFRLAGWVRLPLPACGAPPKKGANYNAAIPCALPPLAARCALRLFLAAPRAARSECGTK